MRSMIKRLICMWMCMVMVLELVPDIGVQAATEEVVSTESSEAVTSSSTFSAWEENGGYYFTTFEDLQELATETYESFTVWEYQGTDPLVISADLVIPENVRLICEDGEIHILQGVTMTVKYDIYMGVIIVDGILDAERVQFTKLLQINNKMYNRSEIWGISNDSEIIGAENIVHDQYARVGFTENVRNYTELKKAVAKAYESIDPEWEYEIIVEKHEEPIIIDESLKVSKNTFLFLNFQDAGVILAEGCTLSLSGYIYVSCPLILEGTLNNAGTIYLQYRPSSGGFMEVKGEGCYKGNGTIKIQEENLENPQEAFLGIDLEEFEIEKTRGYWNIRCKTDLKRLYGSERYETSFTVAKQLKAELGVDKFSSVIVACGTNFADALSGSYLAAVKNAPILIINGKKSETMSEVKEFISNHLASNGTVYLLGGTSAVPAEMENGLDGYTVKRLAGKDRYETNLYILKEAGVEGKDILVATGKGFADSLSASASGLPILLVGKKLNAEQQEFLAGTTGKKIVIGGASAISDSIMTVAGATERLGGATRYETSVMVAERFVKNPTSAVLAYASNFPDGLCGGPLAYAMNAPLILTKSGKTEAAVAYNEKYGLTSGVVIGGPALISDGAVNEIF